jgi:D-beta-D-heptose 7-phosphate kinase/D-beta-D-heptose 1-phosphate adenosyltransferase
MKKIVLVTGGFDPIHIGHINLINDAKKLGDILIVGLNSDDWLIRKKGKPFLFFSERKNIIENLKSVDSCIEFGDSDDSACDAIFKVKLLYPNDQIIFANGGDRTANNIPEMKIKDVIFKFGVGGDYKQNSSSVILNNWKNISVERSWGKWSILSHGKKCKTKELIVQPGQKLSMQRHRNRSEFWFVTEGEATVYWEFGNTKIKQFNSIKIQPNEWHQLANNTENILKIIEIQFGESCDESDIERK